ncbi:MULTISPECIES: reverse transcriptase family protein [unclassified Mesorhizobium]|uniref:reverse transcriptase family protein n=1 Tax=unclassified Mesorhizobium TaxID=325217 RepID=UPI00112C0929|nr:MULTISPECIES: reverse transcriptase family protein [unclassified Mesorhizobium]MBZ9696424.1 reverse transcriptase family protein [Mesorhizobium sp. CO1-1-9]TPK11589.1 RNA-directed DNA polymerase [Mesorhizobium sp. B2-5-7]
MTSLYDFSRITTREALTAVLGIDETMLDLVLTFQPPIDSPTAKNSPEAIKTITIPVFLRHRVPKKNRNRGFRTVWEPILLKSSYKGLARKLDAFFRHHLVGYPHESAFGYRPGRNIRENAQVHAGSARILSLDLADFFPNISKGHIKKLFLAMGVNATVSDLLSRFVTIEGALALGLPTSPVLSNAIALPIDLDLGILADQSNARYSRYADDITFSGNGELPTLERIEDCLRQHGFQIAEGKTRWSKRGQSHYVTGLSVSDPAQPHVPRDRKQALRQQLYYMEKFGIDDHFRRIGTNDSDVIQQALNSIDGMVKFVAHHEPCIAAPLKMQWNEILRVNGKKPSFKPKKQNREPFYIFVDEAEFKRAGTTVLALAMSVSQHEERIVQETREVLEAEMQDFWAAGNIDALRKRGLHFADATEDLRHSYVKRLASMPFEGYVAFHPCADPRNYEDTYLRLLGAMISRRLIAAESQFVCLYFEENSKVSQEAVRSLVQCAHDQLKRANNRHPKLCVVKFVSKPNFGISVPDFLLGVLGKYLHSKPAAAGGPEPRDRLMFDRLRDKYRLILDLSTWTEYSRRQPIEPWQ